MAKESLRFIILKGLHPTETPEKPQTHLLLGKFLGPLHAVVVAETSSFAEVKWFSLGLHS